MTTTIEQPTTTSVLSLSGLNQATLTIPDSTFERRDALAIAAHRLTTIRTADEAQAAGDLLKEISAFSKLVEASRKIIKDPVIELGKRIDALAYEAAGELELEKQRLSRILGTWSAEQDRLRREAEQKARDEEQRIRDEAERKRQEAEKTSSTDAQLERQLNKIDTQEANAIVQTRVDTVGRVAPKVSGTATRAEVCLEVLDIAEVYKHAPHLVKLELNTAVAKSVIKANPNLVVPGLKHWIEHKAAAR